MSETTKTNSALDELARDITTFRERWFGSLGGGSPKEDIQIAGMLFDAGYRKPRVITTVADLDALGDDSVVLDEMDGPLTKVGNWWHSPTDEMNSVNVILPATVLHEGGTK